MISRNQSLGWLKPKINSINNNFFSFQQLWALAKQLDMSEREVERWFRLRRLQDKPTTLVKFCENSFKFTFYTINFLFGIYILWDKEWLWDIDQCYIGYPHQVSSNL